MVGGMAGLARIANCLDGTARAATKTEFFDMVGSEDAADGTGLQTSEELVRTALNALDRKNPPQSVISRRHGVRCERPAGQGEHRHRRGRAGGHALLLSW